jgi:hypothetical protein
MQLGEDPERDGLRDTPEILLGAMFNVAYDEMVVVKGANIATNDLWNACAS